MDDKVDLRTHQAGLRRPGRAWTRLAKQVLALTSIIALLALTVLDWPVERVSQFWSAHPILTGTVTTALILGAGLLAWESARERRLAQMDQSITTAGMAGLVQPLATIDFALTSARFAPDLAASHRAELTSPPLRWARSWLAQGTGLPQDRPAPPIDEALVRIVAEESIRALMSTVRGWTDLLTRTPLGLEATALALSLRPLLMALEQNPSGQEGGILLIDEVRLRARHLAALFDRASAAPQFRPYVDTALRRDDIPEGRPLAEQLPTWMQADASPTSTTRWPNPWSGGDWGSQISRAERAYRERVSQLQTPV